MVQGIPRLQSQLRDAVVFVQEEVAAAIEKMVTEMVREMRLLAPLPEIGAAINWTWGNAPKGAVKIGRFGSRRYGRIFATIYAERRQAWFAPFFEFGTAPRFHKSGKYVGQIQAQPFFYPVLRANRRLFQSRIRAAVNRGMKRANQSR